MGKAEPMGSMGNHVDGKQHPGKNDEEICCTLHDQHSHMQPVYFAKIAHRQLAVLRNYIYPKPTCHLGYTTHCVLFMLATF